MLTSSIEFHKSFADPVRLKRTCASPAESAQFTTTNFDELRRVKQLITPDGAVTATTYSGNQTTVTDPASVQRALVADALDRVTNITESESLLTSYKYDAVDN